MKFRVSGKVEGRLIRQEFSGATTPKQAKAQMKAVYPAIRELKVEVLTEYQQWVRFSG